MSFGIIRVRTISSPTVVAAAENHNKRLEESKRDNIDLSKAHENIHSDFDRVEGSLMESIQKRIDDTKAIKRKNSIIALEYIVALSPDIKKKMYEPENGYDKIAILQAGINHVFFE